MRFLKVVFRIKMLGIFCFRYMQKCLTAQIEKGSF